MQLIFIADSSRECPPLKVFCAFFSQNSLDHVMHLISYSKAVCTFAFLCVSSIPFSMDNFFLADEGRPCPSASKRLFSKGNHSILGKAFGKMPQHRSEIQPKLCMSDHIIAEFVFHDEWILHTRRSAKTMHPTEPGKTETLSASLPELFMNVAFFSTKPPKLRMKAEPGTFQATEYP